jgi:oligopeptide transport system substrate-binding protein
MKHIKQKLSLVLLAALILPILAACGTPQGGGQTQTSPSPAAESPAAESPAAESPAAESPSPAAESPAAESPSPAAESPAAESPAATTGGKVLRVHQITTPDLPDPHKASFTSEIVILAMNYEGLTKLDSQLRAAPAAAESWEFSNEGQTLTFKLRDGLTYSDGSPLTSENFAYAVERTCDPNTAGEYQFVFFEIVGCEDWASTPVTDTAAYDAAKETLLTEGVQTPDEQTLVLNLTRPAPYYPYIAGLWTMYPAKRELVEAGGEDWWKDPANQIGNGPFQLTQYDEGQLAVFEANENYWEGKPKLDGVELVYIKDTSVALEAYRAGQLDVMQPDSSQLPAIGADTSIAEQLLTYAGANSFGMGFNLNLEPFNDKKVREAFAYAFDRETYCNVIRNGDCVPIYSWIPEGVAGHLETDAYKFDPEAARQALAESSYGGPENLPEIKLSFNADDPAAQPRIEWVAQQLLEHLGVQTVIDPVEGQTLTSMRKSNETYPQACLFCANWFQDYPDPQNWISVYWHSSASGASRVGYASEELDQLAEQADVELDETARADLYRQASQVLIDDLPAPFVYSQANVFLVKPNVTGYTTTTADSELPGQWGSLLTLDK